MATLKTSHTTEWVSSEIHFPFFSNVYARYIAYADTQQPMHIAWFLLSLLLHSCLLVPLSFLLIYSLGGPVIPFLAISMSLFFINIVANMGGASTRFTIFIFVTSVILHALMVGYTLVTIL